MKSKFTFQTLIGLGILVVGGFMFVDNMKTMFVDNLPTVRIDAWQLLTQILWTVILSVIARQATRAGAWFWMIICVLLAAAISTSLLVPIFSMVLIVYWKILWPVVLFFFVLKFTTDSAVSLLDLLELFIKLKPIKYCPPNSATAFFFGTETRIEGKYKGSDAIAVFGDVYLDLRHAKIKNGAVIDIFAFCGRVNILLPEDVAVNNQSAGIFGGAGDGTCHDKSTKTTLIIRGQRILGGVDIK